MTSDNLLEKIIKLSITATITTVIAIITLLIYKNENLANTIAVITLLLLIVDSILYLMFGIYQND